MPISLLALDIGATKLAVRAVASGRTWDARVKWVGSEWAADRVLLRGTLAEARAAVGGRVGRVGVASAPTVGADGVVTAWPSRPCWVGAPLLPTLRDAADADVIVADDGSAAALAEARAAGCADLVYLGVGTGLGGGVVSGGRLVLGAHGSAGEIGHLPIDPSGRRCACGRRGCLQTLASGQAIAARASELRGFPTTAEDVVAARSSVWAARVLQEAVEALGMAIAVVMEVVQPARVHLGGGLGAALTDLPAAVGAEAARWARLGVLAPVVAPALLGHRASLEGALLLASGQAFN